MEKPTKEFALKLISYLPSRPDYEVWLNAISAIGNSFDEATALDILLSHFRDEAPDEHLKKLRNPLRKVNFATLVYMAKENGYKPCSDDYKDYATQNTYKPKTSHHKPETVKITTITKLNADEKHYLWAERENELYDELCAISQYENGMTRYEAETFWTLNFSDDPLIAKSETRLFDVMINLNLHNKPDDKTIAKNQNKFRFYRLTAERLIKSIVAGCAILPSVIGSENGNFQRKSEKWIYSDLLFIDVDGTFAIDEALRIPESSHALFLYTTPSHTAEKHRFRIVFALPGRMYNADEYRALHAHYTELYKADTKCKDLSRFYFGNDNAIVINIQNGEIIHYKNGVIQNENSKKAI